MWHYNSEKQTRPSAGYFDSHIYFPFLKKGIYLFPKEDTGSSVLPEKIAGQLDLVTILIWKLLCPLYLQYFMKMGMILKKMLLASHVGSDSPAAAGPSLFSVCCCGMNYRMLQVSVSTNTLCMWQEM